MNIVACIKQVPDTNEVRIDSKTNNLVREGVPSIMNPFDESGVELALRLKERYGGRITVVSMGPGQAQEALQQALDMGADEAILLSDRCRTDFADIQNKKECGGNRQWQNHYLRNWAANTKGKGII